jgi:predicted nicotinamide N-methyase
MTPDPAAFVQARTAVTAPPLVPEIMLHLANRVTPLWHATEAALDENGLDAPYWAFAWAGGQALARYLLDNRAVVAGRRVLDIGAGSGVAAIAAAQAGAAAVTAGDTDPFAAAAITLNAALNHVTVEVTADDLLGRPNSGWPNPGWPNPGWDVVMAGDVCYQRNMAAQFTAWLKTLAADGAHVLLADPDRAYRPQDGLTRVAHYDVPTSREIEDSDVKGATVWRIGP